MDVIWNGVGKILNVCACLVGFESPLDGLRNFPYNFPNMEENAIGTAEIAEATGLSQRLVRYMAAARKIPWPVTRPQKRGFWFERKRLEESKWIWEHTIDQSEPKRRGRKPKAAYTSFRSLAAERPAVLPAGEAIPAKELAEFSKVLAGKLKRIAPRLTLAGSRILYHALRPLECAIRDVAAKYIDDQARKLSGR